MNATAKFTPVVPQLDDDVIRLQKAVLEARQRVNELELEMENPDNSNRCRMLPGKVPDREEMLARVHQLKERIAAKVEQIAEKDVILRELGGLLDRCQAYATSQRDDAFALARAVVEYKQRYRTATRRIMALVSELSMYQATALKLNAEKAEAEAAVAEARARLEVGQAPTAEAERDWQRLQREREVVAELHAQQEAITQVRNERPPTLRCRSICRLCCLLRTAPMFSVLSCFCCRLLLLFPCFLEPLLLAAFVVHAPINRDSVHPATIAADPALLSALCCAQILEQKGTDLRTTAAQRPNAYIPDDMGIPKPYLGTALPFKPSDPGSTMRHIRNPKPREIEI